MNDIKDALGFAAFIAVLCMIAGGVTCNGRHSYMSCSRGIVLDEPVTVDGGAP